MTKNYPWSKLILLFIFAVVIVLGFLSFISPASVFPDPANGFQVMRSMELGGPFNQLISPSQDNIAQNTSEFLTWWSPGQYLVPYVFKVTFGVNTGQASALTVTLCQLLGLSGLYVFFKKIGFSSLVSALSLLFIACQQFFVVPYVFYNGGEILFFAFAGWFLYGCTALKRTGLWLFLFVLLTGWLGFFCKSSVLWMYFAGLLFLWMKLSHQRGLPERVKNGIWIAIPAAIALITIKVFFLSKGDNPIAEIAGLKFSWKVLGFPLASPLMSGFSIDDLLHGLIYHTNKPFFNDTVSVIILLVLAILSLWLVISILKRVPDQNYRLLVKVFYIVSILFFGYIYLRQMRVSYEARHFRIIGLIVIPGAIYLVSRIKPSYRFVFGLIWLGIAITSITYVSKGYSFNTNKAAHGISGIAQQEIDQKSLNQIMALDRQNTNATFVFIGSKIGLEIKHNRVINLEPIGDDLAIDIDDYRYEGHAGPLYIILPESYAGPKEKMVLKSFPGYKGWYGSMLSDNYVMYAAE